MNSISGHFDEVGRLYSEADKEMTSNLTTPDGAMYGDGATKFLAAWDENSGTLDDFIKSFDTWAYAVGKINTQFYQFDAGVYKVRDDVPEGIDDNKITSTARAFHTTALKTTSGQAGFNDAQAAYEMAYKDGEPMKYYDENGVPYTSIKRIENGKIVEDRVYKTEDGEEKYKVEEHWGWDNEKGEFASSNEYYIGGNITGNKEEFDDEYYKTYGDEISDYYRNKYMQKYYAGELTEEEMNAIPPQVKDEVMRRLKQDKEMIMAVNNKGKVVYDENGNITEIVYTDKDGQEYKITYGQDENGQPKVTYTGPDGEIDEEAFNTALEALGKTKKPPLRTGNGIIGGDGTAENPVVEVTNGNIYEIVTDGEAAKITANGKEYTAQFNSDGTVTYTDSDGKEVTDERLKKGLTDAMYGLDERNKARAGVIEKDGVDTITYTPEDNGTVTVEIRKRESINPYYTETITYENDEVSKRHFIRYKTENGEPIKEKIHYEKTFEYNENGNVRHENENYYYYKTDGTLRSKINYSTEIVGDYSKIKITVYGEQNNIIKGEGTRYVDRNSGLYYSELTYNSSGKTVYESGFCYRKEYGLLDFEKSYLVDKETYEKGVKEITEAKQPAEEQQGGQQGSQDEKGN